MSRAFLIAMISVPNRYPSNWELYLRSG